MCGFAHIQYMLQQLIKSCGQKEMLILYIVAMVDSTAIKHQWIKGNKKRNRWTSMVRGEKYVHQYLLKSPIHVNISKTMK